MQVNLHPNQTGNLIPQQPHQLMANQPNQLLQPRQMGGGGGGGLLINQNRIHPLPNNLDSFRKKQGQSLLYKKYILLFGSGKEASDWKDILVYNIETQEWKSITPKNDCELDFSLNFGVCQLSNDKIILYGASIHRQQVQGMGMGTGMGMGGGGGVITEIRACCQVLTLIEQPDSQQLQAQWESGKNFDHNTLPFLGYPTINSFKQKLYICGGVNSEFMNGRACFFIVDFVGSEVKVNNITRNIPMSARFGHTGVVHKDKIYYYGGVDYRQTPVSDMWSFDLGSAEWKEIKFRSLRPAIISHYSAIFARIAGETMFLLGTCPNHTDANYPELITYNINENSWASSNIKIEFKDTDKIFEVYGNTLLYGEPLNITSVPLGPQTNLSKNTDDNTNFKTSDRRLFLEKPFPDITFNVQGKQIPAHRAILVSRSRHFSNMFQSGMKESTSTEIDVPDIKLDIFSNFLEYLYCGDIQDLKEDIAVELLKLADKYSVSGLREYCEHFLINKLRIENVVDLTNLADFCSGAMLLKAGISFIADHFEEIFREKDIKQLSSSVLFEVFNFIRNQGSK